MPDLVRLLARNAVIGFIVAIVFVTLLLVADVANLRTLAGQSGSGLLAVIVLTLFVGLTFASVQMGYAVWVQGKAGEDDDNG